MSFFERWKVNFFNSDLLKLNTIFKVFVLIADIVAGVPLPSYSLIVNILTISFALAVNILSAQVLLASLFAIFGYEHKVFEGLFGYDEEEKA